MTQEKISNIFDTINTNLFRINGKLNYTEVLEEIEKLCKEIKNTETDEFIWDSVGESGEARLGDLLVGTYWFLTDYHSGQDSLEYRVFSRVGEIYSPGMTAGVEEDSAEEDVYKALEELFKSSHPR